MAKLRRESKGRPGTRIGTRLSDQTFRQLIALIFESHFPPGAPLPAERELAEILKVSRPTLREALNRLEAKGYVERRSKSGNYVCTAIPDSASEPIQELIDQKLIGLADVIEVRKILEVWAAQKAAASRNREKLRALRACLDTMQREVRCGTEEQLARYSQADQQFHQVLAEMAGNAVYVHLSHFLSSLVMRSISISKQSVPGDFALGNVQRHERIFEAISERDERKAKAAMSEHFTQIERHLGQPQEAS